LLGQHQSPHATGVLAGQAHFVGSLVEHPTPGRQQLVPHCVSAEGHCWQALFVPQNVPLGQHPVPQPPPVFAGHAQLYPVPQVALSAQQ
jgi:hypothetical protein